ncbi:hypothetical protein K3495_g7119 [Podosphaera aphanis]|nr:hypothetical protein K3495_g7119 [Podosphaera aphanis]
MIPSIPNIIFNNEDTPIRNNETKSQTDDDEIHPDIQVGNTKISSESVKPKEYLASEKSSAINLDFSDKMSKGP